MNFSHTIFLVICIAVTIVVTLKTAPLITDNPAGRPLTQQEGEAILKQLAEIQSTLERIEKRSTAGERPTVPKTASVSTSGRPVLGSPDAKVTVVEFTDYQCPFCSRFETTTFKQLRKTYIDTGDVRWVVLDMPLGFHADAMLASRAAHCAAEQDRFWQLRELLFQNQKQLKAEHINQYASSVGIDTAPFKQCLDSDRYKDVIQRDLSVAEKQNITGTPTFVIGTTTTDVITGRRIVGAQSFSAFSKEIDALLKQIPGS